MRILTGILAAIGWLAAATAQAQTAPVAPIPPAELEAFVDGVVRTSMARDHIAGVTVSVVQNGQVVLKKGYGFASFKPVRPVDADRTLFRIGSITKTFTWIGVMREVEAGRMKLDAPIDAYLPQRLRIGAGDYGPIRVRDLMDHSPGFEDHIFGVLFEKNPAQVRTLADFLAQERPARVRAPGKLSSYSNYGAALAGAALVNVTGQDYETWTEAAIFGPLGMTHTSVREARPARAGLPAPLSPVLAAEVSQPFGWSSTGFTARDYEYLGQVAPAGAGASTAADMARYMMMVMNGGQLEGATVFGPVAAEAFRTPVRQQPPGVIEFRHGFYDQPLPGGRSGYGHNGGTVSFYSNMVLAPELANLGVFISVNTDTGGALQGSLPGAIVQRFYGPAATGPRKGDPAQAAAMAAFAGRYLSTRRAYGGLEGFAHRLVFGTDVAVSPEGYLMAGSTLGGTRAYVPEGDPANGRFVPASGEGGGLTSGGAPMVFEMKDGRPVRINAGAVALERVGPLDSTQPLLLLAILTATAAIATLAGLAIRRRSELRQTRLQAWMSRVQSLQALAWLAALVAFGTFMGGASNIAAILYGWPSPALVAASTLALAAALATVATAAGLPLAWRGDGWTARRKAAFTATVVIYTAFSLLLLRWHALAPWNP